MLRTYTRVKFQPRKCCIFLAYKTLPKQYCLKRAFLLSIGFNFSLCPYDYPKGISMAKYYSFFLLYFCILYKDVTGYVHIFKSNRLFMVKITSSHPSSPFPCTYKVDLFLEFLFLLFTPDFLSLWLKTWKILNFMIISNPAIHQLIDFLYPVLAW